MNRRLTKNVLLGLWSVLWRLALFGALLLPLGIGLLLLLLGFLFVPPIYVITCLMGGRVFLGIGVAVGWLTSLAFSRRLLRRFTEGIEYAGI